MTIEVCLRFAAMGLTLVLTVSVGAQTQFSPDEPWEVPGVGKVIAPLIQARDASVQQVVITRLDSQVRIDLLLDGQPRTVNITPHSLRHEDCRFYISDESGLHEIAAPPVTTYRGEVAGWPGSSVRASLFQDQFSASIEDGAGGRWTIEPADRMIKGLPGEWSVVYRDEDLLDLDISCGVTNGNLDLLPRLAGEKGLRVSAAKASAGVNGKTELGIDADSTFFTLFGTTPATIAAIEERMNIVDYVYRDQVGICYEITGFIIRTTLFAPYDATSTINDLLCAFTTEWNDNVVDSGAGISRDMAHLFTNRYPSPGSVGVAWQDVVCDTLFNTGGFCGSGVKLHYGLSNDLNTLRLDWQVVAHEMGHNWNANHCDGDPDCSIMLGIVNTAVPPAFGTASTASITSHKATRNCLAVCAEPDPCTGDSDGNGIINVLDLLAMLASWGTCDFPCVSDTNDDGTVTVTDLLALLAAWGVCP